MHYLLACMLGAIALAERSPALRFERQPFPRRGLGTDLFYLATGAVALGLGVRAAVGRLAEASADGLPAASADGLPAALGAPLAIGISIVLYDLGAYLCHLLLHRVDALWRLHQVHHSSRTLDWVATFRAHAAEHALRHLASPALLLLAGFPVAAVAVASAVHTVWAAFLHANLRVELRWLEPLLVTPRLHRLHHVPATSQRNLGTLLSVWDRMRGALVDDPAAPLWPLGVPGRVESYPQTWLAQLVEPFRRSRADGAGGIASIRRAGGRTSGA
jgi:sterol desaturase/sphingolipid hydroxylase (fatty acid hydroxylase superfamily)